MGRAALVSTPFRCNLPLLAYFLPGSGRNRAESDFSHRKRPHRPTYRYEPRSTRTPAWSREPGHDRSSALKSERTDLPHVLSACGELTRYLVDRAAEFRPGSRPPNIPAADISPQQSKTDQQISFRNRWSSNTSSLTSSGSWSRCQRHSSRPALSPSRPGAAARTALMA